MTTATQHETREAWLVAAVPALVDLLKTSANCPEFAVPLVSVGFPYRARGTKKGGKAIGQCWTVKREKRSHIFLHPCLNDRPRILDVLLHELIHAAHPDAGHKGAFKRTAEAVGLVGAMTATEAGDELRDKLNHLAEDLGPYPHHKLDPNDEKEGAPKKQGTRMLKWVCPGCGQIIRAAREDLNVVCQDCTEDSDTPITFELEA